MLISLYFNKISAQDIHYSQFYNSPQNINPALVGIFNGDVRVMGNLRDQWRWVPVPWFTFGASYDRKIYPKKSNNHFFSVGANLFHDRQGDSKLNLSTLNVSGSYSHILNKNNIITGGLTLGFSTRGFDTQDLTWDKQWTGEVFDPTLPSGENFDGQRIYFLETGLGLNYRLQKDSRTKLDLGAGLYHLIEPSAGFYDNEDQVLPMNINLIAIGSIQALDILDIQVNVMQQMQGEYAETLVGILGNIYAVRTRGHETNVHLGMGYRTSGSYIPTVAIEYGQYYAGISYDIDNTGFNKFEQAKNGAFELHFRYTITNVKPLSQFKVCPIY